MRVEVDETPVRSYRDLKVWRAAVDLAVSCYSLCARMPKSKTFGMRSQIQRASSSIAANIAEGYGRETTPSFIQFLRVAQGSTKELETHLIIAARVRLAPESEAEQLLAKSDEVGRMLRAMIRSLQSK